MTIIEAINSLKASGLNQKQIADKSDTTQATISRILDGSEPSFSLGSKLIELANEIQQDSAA